MKNENSYLNEIKEIRQIMEQSSRFLSLSGLSGILVGLYALIGAFFAYRMIYVSTSLPLQKLFPGEMMTNLIILGSIILVLSFITVLWLTYGKIKKSGKKFWNAGSKLMSINLAVPLVSGGLLIIIFIYRGIFSIISPSCLVFYGLALVNAAKFTRQEIFYMGLFQVFLGILAAIFPGYGLILWALGFGVIHIIYGVVMYIRYEKNPETA